MGFLYEATKKRCTMCGCILFGESDICECCLDELYDSDPGKPEDEESLYPRICLGEDIEEDIGFSERMKDLIERRLNK